jgi:hypothetical protein
MTRRLFIGVASAMRGVCAVANDSTPWPARAPAHAGRYDDGPRRCRNHYPVVK